MRWRSRRSCALAHAVRPRGSAGLPALRGTRRDHGPGERSDESVHVDLPHETPAHIPVDCPRGLIKTSVKSKAVLPGIGAVLSRIVCGSSRGAGCSSRTGRGLRAPLWISRGLLRDWSAGPQPTAQVKEPQAHTGVSGVSRDTFYFVGSGGWGGNSNVVSQFHGAASPPLHAAKSHPPETPPRARTGSLPDSTLPNP